MGRTVARLTAVLCLLLATAWLCACETTGGAVVPPGSVYVANTRAPFYKYGPAQSFGADFSLLQGQRVTMNERSFGYSRVTTAEGITGYVATDQLTLAPPEPMQLKPKTNAKLPPVFQTPKVAEPKRSSGKPKRSNVAPVAEDPLFDVNDVPAPLPENPEPAPDFRF
jgi:uncharacterized protein YgiM (DUF1202 family)